MRVRRRLFVVFCLLLPPTTSSWANAQNASATADVPAVLLKFSQQVGPQPSGESFYRQVQESLWDIYPQGDSVKPSLVDFVKHGADGPTLGFAGLALIPFHDPATVRPMLERAMDAHTSPATRWCFLNAAPYVLGMGDVWYRGEGGIDKEGSEMAKMLMMLADAAAKSGTGHAHAVQLRGLLDVPEAEKKKNKDYGLAVWHESAYLLGTLDLKDERLLAPGLTSPYRTVFQNVIISLGFAVNRNFLRDLEKKRMGEVTPAMEHAVGKAADLWWQNYLRGHPDGDWHDAVISGFIEAGYKIEKDHDSAQNRRELLRALDDDDSHVRYNAYRLLNETYATHFDLDIAFFAGKYAFSFLNPMGKEAANEARLKKYWQQRLNPQPATTNSHPLSR